MLDTLFIKQRWRLLVIWLYAANIVGLLKGHQIATQKLDGEGTPTTLRTAIEWIRRNVSRERRRTHLENSGLLETTRKRKKKAGNRRKIKQLHKKTITVNPKDSELKKPSLTTLRILSEVKGIGYANTPMTEYTMKQIAVFVGINDSSRKTY